MAGSKRVFLIIIIAVEVITLLIPPSILCVIGLFFSFAFIELTKPNSYFFGAFVLSLAYALFSLWWLVFKHRSISISGIPLLIRIGLGFGTFAALAISMPATLNMMSDSGRLAGKSIYVLVFLTGPVIVLGTLLAVMRHDQRQL